MWVYLQGYPVSREVGMKYHATLLAIARDTMGSQENRTVVQWWGSKRSFEEKKSRTYNLLVKQSTWSSLEAFVTPEGQAEFYKMVTAMLSFDEQDPEEENQR